MKESENPYKLTSNQVVVEQIFQALVIEKYSDFVLEGLVLLYKNL